MTVLEDGRLIGRDPVNIVARTQDMTTTDRLNAEFQRVRSRHRDALRIRIARQVLGSSVIRVFAPNTKPGLQSALERLPVDQLPHLGKKGFRQWYEAKLEHVAEEVRRLNSTNSRLGPGLKWGHCSKVLCLYLRGVVDHRFLFTDKESRMIAPWLYVPIDGVVLDRLRELGVDVPFKKIREIDSAEKFYGIQDVLERAARAVRVPRVWFDDNWADRT